MAEKYKQWKKFSFGPVLSPKLGKYMFDSLIFCAMLMVNHGIPFHLGDCAQIQSVNSCIPMFSRRRTSALTEKEDEMKCVVLTNLQIYIFSSGHWKAFLFAT